MKCSIETLAAIGQTIRVFDGSARRLSEQQVAEIDHCIRTEALQDGDQLTFTIACQALVYSGRAVEAARALVHNVAGLTNHQEIESISDTLRRTLDVCLYEAFRQGESLKFEHAAHVLELLELEIEHFAARQVLDYLTPTENEAFKGITKLVVMMAVPFLNTEHQTEAARLLIKYFKLLNRVGPSFVPSDLLVDIIRKCCTPTRTFFDLSALADLRAAAEETACQWLYSRPPFSTKNGIAERSLMFRFLLSSGNVDLQSRILKSIQSDAVFYDTLELRNLLTNCMSWTIESTLDTNLIHLGEEIFFGIKEMPSSHQYLAMAIRFGDYDRGKRWLEASQARPATLSMRYLEARFHLSFGEAKQSLIAASKPLSVFSRIATQQVLRMSPILDRSPSLERGSGSQPLPKQIDPVILYNLVRTGQEAVFLNDVHAFSSNCRLEVPPTDNRRTIILAPNHLNFVTQLPVAAIEKARQDGSEIVCLVNGLYMHSEHLTAAAGAIKDVIVPGFYYNRDHPSSALSSEWEIAPRKKRIVYKGTNYFYGVHNSLGIHFRRFSVDFDNPVENIQMQRNLVMIEGLHDAFEKFLTLVEDDRIYIFVVIGLQAGLGCAIRTLVTNTKRANIRVVHASNGFETFDPEVALDSVGGNAFSSYHSITDLTDYPNTPLGFRPTPDQCTETIFKSEREYRSCNISLDFYLNKVDFRADEARSNLKPRSDGRRKILIIGTILPDLSIPHDHGLAHEDIVDWVKHTVEIAKVHDFDLIVKPHPAETNQKMGFYVSEMFADLFPRTQNILILSHDANFHEAVFRSDLVVIWSGTSVIELALMGQPYVVCSRFANEEYPISVNQYGSRKEYEDVLIGNRPITINSEGRIKAIDVIHRITTSPLREPSKWPRRQLLNGQVWPPRLDPSISDVLMNDPSTERLAKRLMCKSDESLSQRNV